MRDMFKSICHFTVLMLFCAVNSVFIGGCGTTRNFAIQSIPEGALIIKHDEKEVDESSKWSVEYCGETPVEKKVTFIGDREYYFTAEKRGYKAATQPVSKDAETAISFNLEKIDGVPEKIFEKDNLQSGSFVILPPDLEVIIHSGIGRMDKMEKSSEKSKVVSEQFYSEFIKAIDQNNNKQIRHLAIFEESIKNDWEKFSSELNDYILKLSIERLNYYSSPPFITAKVEAFETLIDRIKEEVESDNTYLLYIWGKCISETKGRKAGNIIFSILGPTVAAANPSAIYDPAAFGSSTGTTIVLFVIDAKTSEVLFIEPRYLNYDITDFDSLLKAVSIISRFPVIDNKER